MVRAPKNSEGKVVKGFTLPYPLVIQVERAAVESRMSASAFVERVLADAVRAEGPPAAADPRR